MKHTQGPWNAVKYQNTSYYTVRQEHKTYGIDAETIVGSDTDMKFHNAHLIAAAPEMLEELEQLREALNDSVLSTGSKTMDEEMLCNIRKLIKKARGE